MVAACAALLLIRSEVSHGDVIRRLAAHPDGYRRVLASLPNSRGTASKWIEQAGLAVTFGDLGKVVRGGVYAAGAAKVSGDATGFVIRLSCESTPDARFENGDLIALFLMRNRSIEAKILDEDMQREHGQTDLDEAVLLGEKLILSGLWRPSYNWPHPSVRAYRKSGQSWKLTKILRSMNEGFSAPRLRLSRDGRTILPVAFVTRRQPVHLSASHASSDLSYREQWSFPNGTPHADWIVKRKTPFNRLDSLYGYLAAGNRSAARGYCANDSIFKRVWALRSRVPNDEPRVSLEGPGWLDARRIAVGNLATIFTFGKRHGSWVVVDLADENR